MREATIVAAVVMAGALLWLAWPWLRDRYAPIPVPVGFDEPGSLDEIRPGWDEPLTGEVLIRDPHLGDLPVIDPVPPRFFHEVRELHPVDLGWAPAPFAWGVTP
jgi:hypothetical protein